MLLFSVIDITYQNRTLEIFFFTNFVIINIFCLLLEKYYITIFNRQIANKEKTDIHIFYPLLEKYYITIFNRQIANKEKNSSFETGTFNLGGQIKSSIQNMQYSYLRKEKIDLLSIFLSDY